MLEGLHQFSIDFFHNNLRFRNTKLETFTAHLLNDNSQLQFASADDLKSFIGISAFHADRHVVQKFFFQTLQDLTASYFLAVHSTEWTVIHREDNSNCRLFNADTWKWSWLCCRSDGVTNGEIFHTCNDRDVTGANLLNLNRLIHVVLRKRSHAEFLIACFLGRDNLIAHADFACAHTANCQTANETAVRQITDQDLQWLLFFPFLLP